MTKKIELNFSHPLPQANPIRGRHPFIVDYCRGKKVLHIGCVDAGLLEERYNKNQLLHQKLDKVASLLYGVDIDVDGVSFLKEKGFDNLFLADICDELQVKVLSGVEFDVIVLSEVIEHLNNPGLMLESVKKLMHNDTELLVSVPNAFSAENIWNMLKGMEYVHPDHNYYFSFVTFNNILKKSKLDIKEIYVYSFSSHAFKRNVNIVKSIYWYLFESFNQAGDWLKFLKILSGDFLIWLHNFWKNIFVKFLYSRSGFFGDGLLIACKLPAN